MERPLHGYCLATDLCCFQVQVLTSLPHQMIETLKYEEGDKEKFINPILKIVHFCSKNKKIMRKKQNLDK